MKLRVGVIGVRGVGKFHAQWYTLEGCEVVAFVSSCPETMLENEASLRKVVPGFQGKGYFDLRAMLESERPDAVSVCSPHHLHAEHCLEVISYGAHVLCEKPLVWLGVNSLGEALTKSQEIVTLAYQKGCIFAVNTQYVACVPQLYQIWREKMLPEIPDQIELTMEAKIRSHRSNGLDLLVDLAPHPISLLLALFPDASFDFNEVFFEEHENKLTCNFGVVYRSFPIGVRICLGRLSDKLERSIIWNGCKVGFESYFDERGIYRTRLIWDSGEWVVDDFMQSSIRRFIQSVQGSGRPLCDGRVALLQEERLIELVKSYLSWIKTGATTLQA